MKFPREHKLLVISHIQHYFLEQRGEELGNLAAENLLDFMLKEIAPYIYNLAIEDARGVAAQRMISLEEDLYALEKPTPLVKRS